MPVSKNRRIRRKLSPRKFTTVKAAKRYLMRFQWRFAMYGRYNSNLRDSFLNALRIVRTGRL